MPTFNENAPSIERGGSFEIQEPGGSSFHSTQSRLLDSEGREIKFKLDFGDDQIKINLTPHAATGRKRRGLAVTLLILLAIGLIVAVKVYGWTLKDAQKVAVVPPWFLVWFEKYGTIPIVSALVGWGTNTLAISMTFYPLEFKGCFQNACSVMGMPLCGWIGIIPSSCEDMARSSVELMTTRLMDVGSVFSKLDPKRMQQELRPAIENVAPKILETIATEYFAKTWSNLPAMVQSEIKKKCLDDCSAAITDVSGGGGSDISEVIDMSETIVELFTRDKQLMNDIFEKVGEYEFWFIKVSGFYLGFLFGLAQMGLWYACPRWWVLPVAGFLVGYLTNWVALKVIFLPVQPTKFCCFTVQGLFLKRQREVSLIYAELFSTKVLTAENLILGIITGAGSDKLFEQMDKSIQEGIDGAVKSQRVAKMVIGSENYAKMKARISELIRTDIKVFVKHITPYLDEAFDVKKTLENSMLQLSCEEFEQMLHPVFEEGEMKLVLIGGFLGVVIGMVQALVQVPDQFGITAWAPVG